MEEVDNIVFPILKDIGCTIPDEINSIKLLQSEHFYHICAVCLNSINPARNLATVLPTAKAASFRVASAISVAVEEMGYTGEIGYQSFLYPTEHDIRAILSFLIDKLPKVEQEEDTSTELSAGNLSTRIKTGLVNFVNTKWTQFHRVLSVPESKPFSTCTLSYCKDSETINASVREYYRKYQPYLTMQCNPREKFIPSVFENISKEVLLAEEESKQLDSNYTSAKLKYKDMLKSTVSSTLQSAMAEASRQHALDAAKSLQQQSSMNSRKFTSTFQRKTDFTQEKTVVSTTPGLSKEELDAKELEEYNALLAQREEELSTLQTQLEDLVNTARNKKKHGMELESNITTLEQEIHDMDTQINNLEAEYKTKKRVVDLLPNAHENITKLRELADKNVNRLLELNQEWEVIRNDLIKEYRTLKSDINERGVIIGKCVDELKQLRSDMKQRVAEIREKEQLYQQYVAELNALPKSINRQVYVKRIIDIVRNIEKQKEEIRKILADVQNIQREINAKGESVRRSFDVADELIYQVAKIRKDPTAIQVYKNVVALRSGFNHIIETVENTGKISNNIRELQQKIELLETRNSSLNKDAVLADLQQVKNDNMELKAQLKKYKQAQE